MQSRNLRTRWQSLRRRRLLFETLERRDLLTVMRIVDWNTMNGPNDATGDANYATIFQAIGNETVQGNTERIDILALQETDPPGPGNDSIGRIQNILNTLYPNTTYSSVVTAVDGGGDSTGFVYDTSSVTLLQAVPVLVGQVTHSIERAKFRPVGTTGASDFYVYSIHLKSGDGSSETATRASEAALLRSDADSLGEGAQVLFVGDFNMHGSEEGAYQKFVAAGNAQLQDVANAPGHWNGNAAFKSLHTQDPRGNMDDRFDIQFATGELFDGVGVDYVPNSFHVFGNNGTHTFGQPITTGTGASPTVLSALVAATDHLPAVADYQLVGLTPNVHISETLGRTKVVEGGLYDTYQVVLDTVPAANVTITVTPDSQVDVGNGAGVAAQLTFTPANALTPQTVVVHAADDSVEEGDHTGLITHSSASTDAGYNGLSIANVNVSIVDNDAPKILINEVDADQAGTDTAEFVELYDGGVGNASLDGYLLVFFNGNVTTPGHTNGSYKSVNLSGQHTNSNGFFVLGDSGMLPAPDLAFAGAASNQIMQGPDGIGLYKFTAEELNMNPNPFPTNTSPTTSHLRDAIVYTTGPGGTAVDQDLVDALNPGHPQINENQNGGTSGEMQSISRVPDGGTPFDTSSASYRAQTPTPKTYNQALPFGVQIIQSGGRIDVQEGGTTDSYQLALLSLPTLVVHIVIDPDNQVDLGAGPGAPITLDFTPTNALIPQTVTVTAVNDGIAEGARTSIITQTISTSDSRYNGLAVSNVVANVTDPPSSPPGDYNRNGVVDAADYVLWRQTLGSTTNLAADGSGPTPGVPNGVVDQFDYTYWRANFGAIGTGSASSTDAVADELAADTSQRQSITTAPAADPSNEPAKSADSVNESAVDIAMTELNPVSTFSKNAATSHSHLRWAMRSDIAKPDTSLLSLSRPASSRRLHNEYLHNSPSDSCNELDNVFATLDAGQLGPDVRLLSVL